MIKKLRRRFIGISLLSIFLVLFLILGITNIVSIASFQTRTDELLITLLNNNGEFPESDDKNENEDLHSTRYFTVALNESGILHVDTTNIVRVNTEEASMIAIEEYKNNVKEGSIDSFAFKSIDDGSGARFYVFLDISKSVTTLNMLFNSSIIIGIAGIVLFFIVIYIFSRIAFKPVADSYKKQKLFITNASHELKTPLAVISANNEVIEMEHGEDEWTNSTKKQIAGMTELIKRLITLSKIDEEGKENFSIINLSDILVKVKDSFKSLEITMNKPIHIELEDNLTVKGNPKELSELFSILIENSMKYAVEGKPIDISLKRKKKAVIFTLKNGSTNFKPGNHNYLFERFYRSNNDSSKAGFGIGLSIAKAICENHRGKINAECISEDEVVFTVVLPYAK